MSTEIAPVAEDPTQTVVVFRSGRSLADTFLTVSVGQGELRGDQVDLDGDGVPEGGIGGNETGLGISWRLADGSIASIGATAEQAALDYAREVYSPTLGLDNLPTPAGLPERDTWTFFDPRGPEQTRVTYAPSGSRPRIVVSTTNRRAHGHPSLRSAGHRDRRRPPLNPSEAIGGGFRPLLPPMRWAARRR